MSKTLFNTIAIIAGLIVLYFIAANLFAEHKVPTVSEFYASTTEQTTDSASTSPSTKMNSFGQLLESISSSSANLSSVSDDASTSSVIGSDTNASAKNPLNDLRTTTVYTSKGSVKAFVADTEASREQGLSGQPSLANGTGVLFVFETIGKYGFWMKDMHFPIDIIWIGQDKKIVGVTKNVLPSSYPFVFMPPKDILYVIEVNAGSAASSGLTTGTSIKFSL